MIEENCYDWCYLRIGVVVCNNLVTSLPISLAVVFLGTIFNNIFLALSFN